MANQIMTIKEVERYIGISNVDEADWVRGTYIVASTLRSTLAMFSVGGTAMAVGAIIAPFAAFVAVLCALGFSVAEAKEIVSKRAARHGYAIGVVLALFGYDRYFMSTFIDNTSGSPGVAPSYMTGIYKASYNGCLLLGYSSVARLTAKEKEELRGAITQFVIKYVKSKGHKINMDSWSDRRFVHYYARTFNNNMRS